MRLGSPRPARPSRQARSREGRTPGGRPGTEIGTPPASPAALSLLLSLHRPLPLRCSSPSVRERAGNVRSRDHVRTRQLPGPTRLNASSLPALYTYATGRARSVEGNQFQSNPDGELPERELRGRHAQALVGRGAGKMARGRRRRQEPQAAIPLHRQPQQAVRGRADEAIQPGAPPPLLCSLCSAWCGSPVSFGTVSCSPLQTGEFSCLASAYTLANAVAFLDISCFLCS
jgi:hypothetical protein